MVNIQNLYRAMKIKYFEAGWPLTGLITSELCDSGLVLFISLRDLYARRYSCHDPEERSRLAMWQSLFYCLVQQGFDASQDDYGMTGTAFTGYLLEGGPFPPAEASRERQLAYVAALILRQFAVGDQARELTVVATIDGVTRGRVLTELLPLEQRRLARGRLWLRAFCLPMEWTGLSYDLSAESELPLRELADALSQIETMYRLPSDLIRRRVSESTTHWSQDHGMMPEAGVGVDPLVRTIHLLGKIASLHSYETAYRLDSVREEPLPF